MVCKEEYLVMQAFNHSPKGRYCLLHHQALGQFLCRSNPTVLVTDISKAHKVCLVSSLSDPHTLRRRVLFSYCQNTYMLGYESVTFKVEVLLLRQWVLFLHSHNQSLQCFLFFWGLPEHPSLICWGLKCTTWIRLCNVYFFCNAYVKFYPGQICQNV